MDGQLRRFEGMFRDLSNKRRVASGGEPREYPIRRHTSKEAQDAPATGGEEKREVESAPE